MGNQLSNIFQAFTNTVKTATENGAVIYREGEVLKTITYADLWIKSLKLGNKLKNLGVHPGEKVAVILENQPEYAFIPFAIFYASAVFVPLDPQSPGPQIKQLILHCQARLLLVGEKIFNRVKESLPSIETWVVDSEPFRWEMLNIKHSLHFLDDGRPEKLAALFYTSGTTDTPKAVMLSHQNLLANVASLAELNIIQKSDRIVAMLPLHHTYAFTTTLLTPLLTGAAITYPGGLSTTDIISCLQETKATIMVGVPQIYSLLARGIQKKLHGLSGPSSIIRNSLTAIFHLIRRITKINLSSFLYQKLHQSMGGHLRYLISGGAKLDSNVARDFERLGFTILEGYGLTETSPVVTFNPPSRYKIGSVGKPIAGVAIKVADPGANGVGEVAIRGQNVMLGYYQMERETHDVIHEDWFFSGDLGYIDDAGYLYIVGRKKEIFVFSSGKKVEPEEIETHYSQTPFIKEIAVLANPKINDTTASDQLVAVIVVDEEHFRTQNETNIHERLKWELDNLSAKLPPYKRIHGFVISQEPLPRTRLGKIMRYKLSTRYLELRQLDQKGEGAPPAISDARFSEPAFKALQFIEESLKRKVALKDHLELDLGLDSLGRIELLLGIQEKLQLTLPDESAMEFFMCNTMEELLNKLNAVLPAQAIPRQQRDHPVAWGDILNEPLRQETAAKINLSPGFFNCLFNFIMVVFLKIIFHIFFLLRVDGKNNLDTKGPYLICPNHTSYLDGLFILTALPFKIVLNTYFVGFSAVFEHFLLKPFMRVARLIPLEVSFNLIETLKAVTYVLKQGKIVCYFPEGQRSIDGELNKFKKGIGILVKELDVPVIPVYLKGAFHTWNRTQRGPHFAPVKVYFGKKIYLHDLLFNTEISNENSYAEIAHNLQNELARLVKHVNENKRLTV